MHYRDKLIHMSRAFVQVIFSWISKPQNEIYHPCFPWSITIHVFYVGSCFITYLKKSNPLAHLIRQLHQWRNRTVWSMRFL